MKNAPKSLGERLRALRDTLPPRPQPAGNYQAFTAHEETLYVSGQLPIENGALAYKGKLGRNLNICKGKAAFKLCALNLLAQLSHASEAHPLDRILRLEGYLQCDESFTEHAAVLDGASDFLYEALGQCAEHSRIVIGCNSLPGNATAELSAIVAIKGG